MTRDDVEALRSVGLTDVDVADVVYAVGARAFFTRVLDGLGALTDHRTAATFDDEDLATMVVGRPVGPPAPAEGGPADASAASGAVVPAD
ncbi:hypothetical protein WDV85_08985 [Pseudokineococcus sp. 5B2Z-1]|uniref:hypothetical protein n=1 Tax=Pseudokineococcus sp. 5B2Z-1 TaxID=3132744 RepID=UPI0030A65CC4